MPQFTPSPSDSFTFIVYSSPGEGGKGTGSTTAARRGTRRTFPPTPTSFFQSQAHLDTEAEAAGNISIPERDEFSFEGE